MHKAEAGPAHQDRAYDFVECPMKAGEGVKSDIDPANMVVKDTGGGAADALQLSFLMLAQLDVFFLGQ